MVKPGGVANLTGPTMPLVTCFSSPSGLRCAKSCTNSDPMDGV